MVLTRGTNCGFVSASPSADPSTGDTINAGDKVSCFKDTSPIGNNTITEIGWYCENAVQEANFEVAIYNSSGGVPTTIVGSDKTNAKGTTAGWKKVTGLNIVLSPSTEYFVVIQVDTTATDAQTLEQTAGAIAGDTNWQSGISTLPDPYGAGTARTKFTAIYAKYEDLSPTTVQSKSIDFNNGTITQATLTTTLTGNALTELQMTADGTNWENVTSGVAHTFTNTGTDLKWKATGVATTITKLEIGSYH